MNPLILVVCKDLILLSREPLSTPKRHAYMENQHLARTTLFARKIFCLAYALTFRDFIGGTLGLAWVASPTFSTAGGICQIYQKYNEGQQGTAYRSLNTGIITLVNYGNRVPLRVSQLTMAHEIGHNFGSPHDQTADCQPGLPDGNLLLTSISQVLYEVLQQTPIDAQHSVLPMFGKKRNCFQERTSAFCGNQIREPGEQCDCGFSQHDCEEMGDRCCQPRENHQNPCKRTLHARCSPSEGLCCKASVCDFYTVGENQLCREESECLFKQFCNGQGAACPDSAHKPNGLPCQDVTKVCHGGSCNGSICAEVGLKDCFLTEGKPTQLCHLACEKNGTCYSSFDLPEFAAGRFHQLNRENAAGLLLHPGSPCNNYKGYCDILRKCRSRKYQDHISMGAGTLVGLCLHWYWSALFMALFVKCCAVHTPSTNPNKIPAQHLSDTLRHPGTLLRRGRQPTRPPGHGAMPVPTSQPQPSGNAGQRAHRNRPNGQIAGNGQRANQRTAMPSASHHVSGNRVPPNLSAPPLIPPPPNSSQPVIVASSGVVINQQSTSPVHDPPPPYTPTDPAASTSATPLPTTAQSPVLIGGIASPVPTPVFLPGAPLPPPLVPGPPFLIKVQNLEGEGQRLSKMVKRK
uniref:ADAM10 endopeptidase n=1 Tax=Ditylenchus dipsaci TaxID=166011 RepID=A0A915CVK0_9BILA